MPESNSLHPAVAIILIVIASMLALALLATGSPLALLAELWRFRLEVLLGVVVFLLSVITYYVSGIR